MCKSTKSEKKNKVGKDYPVSEVCEVGDSEIQGWQEKCKNVIFILKKSKTFLVTYLVSVCYF